MPPDVGTAQEGKERKPDKAGFEGSDTRQNHLLVLGIRADSTRSRTHSSRCRKGAEHSSGHEQALAAHRRAGPEGPRANASVCGALVPKGLMGSCSSSLALKTLYHGDPPTSLRYFHPGLVFHYP